MAFTDVEMAILSQLAYTGATKEVNGKPPSTAPERGDSLYSFIVKNEKWLNKALGDGYKDAIEGLKTKTKDSDYSIVKEWDDKTGTGFAALAIKDPDNNVTVATRGTEGFKFDYDSRKDVYADAQLAYSISTSQQEAMEVFMKSLELNNYDGYYFTGHSLGGNLALYGAATFVPIEKVKGVVTFNAPGFNEGFLMKYAAEIARIHDRTTNYQNEYDSTSSILYVPGNVEIIETSDSSPLNIGDLLGFDDHGLKCLTVKGDGFKKKPIQVKGIQTTGVHIVVEGFRFATGIKNYTVRVGVIELAIKAGRNLGEILKNTDFIEWIKRSHDLGYDYASENPSFMVDTVKLRAYADRLEDVNCRLAKLDKRLDSLYLQVGLLDLFKLIQADLLTGQSWRISNCVKYLDETANDFDKTERKVVEQFGG